MKKIVIVLIIGVILITLTGMLAQAFTGDDLNDTINMIIVPTNTALLGVIVVIVAKMGKKDDEDDDDC